MVGFARTSNHIAYHRSITAAAAEADRQQQSISPEHFLLEYFSDASSKMTV